MQDTRSILVEAATDLFSRYGVKRTSLADVAAQAGVSRQTLYASFANKEDLLAAAMQLFVDQIVDRLGHDWASCTTADEIISVYFKHAVLEPFAVMQKAPDLKDLLNGVGDATSRVAKQAIKKKTKLLAGQFEPYRKRLESLDSDPDSVANLIVMTTHEFKLSASTRQELKRLLDTLKLAACSMLEP